MFLIRLALTVIGLLPVYAHATNPCAVGMRYFARFTGPCIGSNYFGHNKKELCSGFSYDIEQDKSVYIAFYIGDIGNIYFNGTDKGSVEPNADKASFQVTSFEIVDKQGKTTKMPASGQCTLQKNDNDTTTVVCSAKTARGPLQFRVISTAEPPEVTDCEE